MPDPAPTKQYSPAAERNWEPILTVLQQVLPGEGCVLEVASGTGQHAAAWAPHLAPRLWLPSDLSPLACDSIAAWRRQSAAANFLAPIALDVSQSPWPVESMALPLPIRAVVNLNMIHIAPWACCLGLMAGAGRLLSPGGVLFLYGPYRLGQEHTAPSNAAFDQRLRSQNPAWGVRDLEAVVAAAAAEGLRHEQLIPMPANNFSVVFRRA